MRKSENRALRSHAELTEDGQSTGHTCEGTNRTAASHDVVVQRRDRRSQSAHAHGRNR
jgi:hypothetical protein